MRRRAQRQAAEAGRWRVWVMSRWKAFCSRRGGGEKAQQKEVIQLLTVTDEGEYDGGGKYGKI